MKKPVVLLLVFLAVAALVGYYFFAPNTKQEVASSNNQIPLEKKRGGLIYGEKYSYNLLAPEGWVIDTEAGAANGFNAVFYPMNKTWQTAEAIIYTVAEQKNGKNLEQYINSNINWYKSKFAEVQVSDWEPLTTSEGQSVPTKLFDADSKTAMELVAYVDSPYTVNRIVLVAKNEDAFTAGFSALDELVKSYKFVSADVEVKTPEQAQQGE